MGPAAITGPRGGDRTGGGALPESFRKLSLGERQEVLRACCAPEAEEWQAITAAAGAADLADIMVEAAVGSLPLPLGLATGFLIDGQEVTVPMAVEEPSVIAAASHAARVIRRGGGFQTWATEPLMTAQVFLEGSGPGSDRDLEAAAGELGQAVDAAMPGMAARGGGFRALRAGFLAGQGLPGGLLRVDLVLDVRDAMGANLLNTAVERLRPELERRSGGRVLMSVLSNEALERRAGARFALPVSRLAPLAPAGMSAADVARRVELAGRVAREDRGRAVTHNKGIMNGITALALATMNDTRALEAAAHAWASREGPYRALSEFVVRDGRLEGSLELPLALATVGGAVGFHPASRLALRVLGFPDARRLARIAAALGLAQNFAAVLALVTRGIQHGHMKYHAARLAYQAGARGPEVRAVAERIAAGGEFSRQAAQAALLQCRSPGGSG